MYESRRAVFARQMGTRPAVLLFLGLLLLMLPLAACGGTTPTGTAALKPITIGLTYVPDVQFAPFYVADSLGYYKAAGVNVTLRHHAASEDEFGAIVAGRENAIFAGGDELLQARSKGVQLVDVATIFAHYPVALIVPANSPIRSAADLRGHTIGVPGPYGATYIGLLALLSGANLTRNDVTIQSIGYTQVTALLANRVDAVMGYVNNEPIQFEKAGFAIRTLSVGTGQPLVSNGLAFPQQTLSKDPALVRAVVQATLRGMEYTLAHPDEALTISKKYVPGLADPKVAADKLAVLRATLPLWQSTRPGYNDPAAWSAMATFLSAQGILTGQVDPTQAYSNDYLP